MEQSNPVYAAAGAHGCIRLGLKWGTVAGTTLARQSGMSQRPHGMPAVRGAFGYCHVPWAVQARTQKGISSIGFVHTKQQE